MIFLPCIMYCICCYYVLPPTEQWYSLPCIMYCICCYYVLPPTEQWYSFHASCIAFAVTMYYPLQNNDIPSMHHVLHLLLLCTTPYRTMIFLPCIMYCICCYYVLPPTEQWYSFHASCIAFAVTMYYTLQNNDIPSMHHVLHLLLLCTTPYRTMIFLPCIMYCICCYYVLQCMMYGREYHFSVGSST